MSRLTLPTTLAFTLFIAGWAAPAGSALKIETLATANLRDDKSAFAELFDAKTTLARASSEFRLATAEPSTPAFVPASAPVPETTNDILVKGDDAQPTEESAAQDSAEVAPVAIEPVRLPPRRAIAKEIVCETLADAAVTNNVPTPFLIRLIWRESGFNQNAISPVGAQGVAQFMPATAAQYRLADPFDPLAALHASARMLRGLIQQFGNVGLAAAAYNAGPRRVADWLASKKGKLPQETRDYVQNITGKPAEHWRTAKATIPVRIPAAAPCQREAGLLAANGPEKIPLPPKVQLAAMHAKPKHEAKPETKQEAKAETPAPAKTASAKSEKTKVAMRPGKPLQLAADKTPPAKPEKQDETKRTAKRDAKPDRKRVKVADAANK